MSIRQRKVWATISLMLAVYLSATTGCAGRNGAPRRWTDEPAYSPDRSTIVRKPPLEATNPKPVFLGGYAGANY